MSIPPLVCSTPPPPDQCEDENEHEDFDIPYHLSQEDEDDGYDYGNFTFSPHSGSSESKKDTGLGKNETLGARNATESTRTEDVEIPIEIEHNHIGTNTNIKNVTKSEEDPNIEDLDLKINEEPLHFTTKEVNINQISDDYNLEISDYANTVSDPEASPNHESSPSKDRTEDDVSSDSQKDISVSEDRELHEHSLHEVGPNITTIEEFHNAEDTTTVTVTEDKPEKHSELTEDDDFGDFEDFQFVNSQNRTLNTIESCDNPWVNNDSEELGFGEFTANFNETEVQKVSYVVEETTITRQQSNETSKAFDGDGDDDDDDFGDFDDFKSSSVDKTSEEADDLSRTVPVLHFQMSDNEMHVLESLNKVLSSIFEEEISQPAVEFEGRLESSLSVTWGHLKETDVRQPYILNWNNSLGQKSLLKALCIDSRNILFGPKWGYNPPKYAANMGMAPLQPKKPLTPSNSGQNENTAAEKTSKASNWVDSFTTDGQESCSTENQGEVELKPSNIDVFEAATSSKTDKIYSSTLNVQPLRQISLPDTHIFTPTDSETPRSKTIHYDNGPPILLPQPVLEVPNKQENPTTQANLNNDNKDDDDYWEFQDFRSRSEPTATLSSSQKPEEKVDQKSENTFLKPNITYQTQILQPVKMEPIMPTLNWPDPGQVKETIEEFTDFISNSSWGNDTVNSQMKSSSVENKTAVETGVLDKINDKHKGDISVQDPTTQNAPDNDDEFDTFQSALPPRNAGVEFNINANFNTNIFTNIPKQTNQSFPQIANFEHAFPKVSTAKSDVISLDYSIPNETLGHSLSYFPNTTETSSAKPSTPSGSQIPNMLQPTPAPVSTTFTPQQNTGQILQPLSLESYSQINWPSPGIDLQDLSRFNPVETLQSLKTDLSVSGTSKTSSPDHMQKPVSNTVADDDIWGEFVSSRPKQQSGPKKAPVFADDDEWTDFVSSPSVKPINGLNTISLNVHTNSNIQKSSNNKFTAKGSHLPLDIPTLNYITPKTSGHNTYNNRHFENL